MARVLVTRRNADLDKNGPLAPLYAGSWSEWIADPERPRAP